jgi:amidophosphoribosyltransferase
VIGVSGHSEAANLAYLALYAMQHRGKESCGIATRDGGEMTVHKGMGLVADNFGQKTLETLPGRYAIGHVRYSTSGSSSLRDAQPFLASSGDVDLAVAHNGNLTNALAIRHELEGYGSIFQSTMDSEVFVHLYARARGTIEERITDAL